MAEYAIPVSYSGNGKPAVGVTIWLLAIPPRLTTPPIGCFPPKSLRLPCWVPGPCAAFTVISTCILRDVPWLQVQPCGCYGGGAVPSFESACSPSRCSRRPAITVSISKQRQLSRLVAAQARSRVWRPNLLTRCVHARVRSDLLRPPPCRIAGTDGECYTLLLRSGVASIS